MDLKALELQARKYASEFEELISDHYKIISLIEDDPALSLNDDEGSKQYNVSELRQRDSELTKKLQQYLKLKEVADLLTSFNNQMEVYDFVSGFDNLHQINQKVHSIDLSKQGIRFEQALITYIDTMHTEFIKRMDGIFAKLWTFTEKEIIFSNTNFNGNKNLDYDSMFKNFSKFFLKDHVVNSNSWFLTSINGYDFKEEAHNSITQCFNNYIMLTSFIDQLKGFLFEDDVLLSREANRLKFFRDKKSDPIAKLNSYQTLVNYLTKVLTPTTCNQLLSAIGNIMVTEIKKLLKQNSKLFLSNESLQKTQLIKLNEDLVTLGSQNGCKWSYDGDQIGTLLNDENIYINLVFDHLLQTQLKKIRGIFATDSWLELRQVKLEIKDKERQPETKQTESQGDHMKEWEWTDDDNQDGWDNEFEVDLNVADEVLMKKEKENKQLDIQNPKDGWDDMWEDDILDVDERTQVVEITEIPERFQDILADFEIGCKNLDLERISSNYNYKFNLLQTSFFAMCNCKYPRWWMLVKDMKYILSQQKDDSLYQLLELTTRYVDTHIGNMQRIIYSMVKQQLTNFQENENSPNWKPTLESLLPFLEKTAFSALNELNDENKSLEFLDFIYTECLVSQIMRWKIISEKNSENLSAMIGFIYEGTKIPSLQHKSEYRHARTKIAIISRVLAAHLKDIMEMFYSGDFFLFSTDEIIQWIVLLFADTSMRRDCIYEVRTIREESKHEET